MTITAKRFARPRIVQLAPETLSKEELVDEEKLSTRRATSVSRSIVIQASAERCFGIISRQLQRSPDWDPAILAVNPVSSNQPRVGFMSQIAFRLNGVRHEAIAMIRTYRPNRTILWTSNHRTHLQEEWQLRPESHGTEIAVTVAYNPVGWMLGRLSDRLFVRGKVEKAVSEMLLRLKAVAEKPSQLQGND